MNNAALVSRADPNSLPQYSAPNAAYYYGADAPPRSSSGAKLLSALRRYWWILALIWFVVAVPWTLYVLRNVSPAYIALGAIRVAPTRTTPLTGDQSATPFYNEYMRTQAEFIKSSRVLQRAAEDPRLRAYPWFRALGDQMDFLITHVEVTQVPSSQLITLSVTDTDAHAASDFVNAVIDAYIRLISEDEENNVGRSLTIIRGLRDRTESFLKENQEKLLRLTSDGANLSTEDDRKVIIDLIAASRTLMSKLETDQINLQATLDNLQHRGGPDEKAFKDAIPLESDHQIEKWLAEKVRIQMTDSILASRGATEDHPDRVQGRHQLKTLTQRITDRTSELKNSRWLQYQATAAAERSRRAAELESDLKSLANQLAALKTRIAQQDDSARTINGKLQPILNLREQIADAKEALKRYNDRIQELDSQNVSPGRVALGWSAAVPLTPKVDKRIKLVTAANGSGLLLGAFALVLLARLRNRIETSDDLPDTVQPLVIGTVSHAAGSRGLPGRMHRKILGEEMRLVHANLLPAGKSPRRIMMITSPTPGNGKTSISSHLALSLAKSGLQVLLIDADLRKRDLTSMFDIGFRPGLAELLQGQNPELVGPVELLPNFRVMGAGGRIERNPVELLQAQPFRDALARLGDTFDCILIDTPPTLIVADSRFIAPSCDEILVVIRAQVTSPREVNETIDALARVTALTPKLIVNGVAQRQRYYKYKFSYTDVHESPAPTAAT